MCSDDLVSDLNKTPLTFLCECVQTQADKPAISPAPSIPKTQLWMTDYECFSHNETPWPHALSAQRNAFGYDMVQISWPEFTRWHLQKDPADIQKQL